MTTPQSSEDLLTLATSHVAALRALPMDAEEAELDERAVDAVADLEERAMLALFPLGIHPVDAGTIAIFEFIETAFTRTGYLDQVAELHLDALTNHPGLATFLRSAAAVGRIADVARARACTMARDPDEFAAAEITRYQRAIALQLVLEPAYEPHASIVARQAPALREEIDADRALRRDYRAEVLAKVDADQQAAAAVVAGLEADRRARVHGYFARHSGRRFILRGSLVSGQGLAAALHGALLRDLDAGADMAPVSLDELELLMRQTEAADTVVLA